MKSTAQFKGHPLHPILVAFPIAFFIGAFVFDIISMVTNNDSFWLTGKYLAIGGIICGLAAAVPGIIDYVYTVPPKSSGKTRATQHALTNTSVLIIFAIALVLRKNANLSPYVIIGIEGIGVVLLVLGGWMGGTLVYRNQIGVDPRYADAGKWNEERIDGKSGKIQVAKASELKVNQMKLVHVNGKRIVVGRTEKEYAAFDDRCTHRGGSLAGGAMICGTVQCPWHGSQFDVLTGIVKAGPAKDKIDTYKLTEKNGKIFLHL